VNQLCHIVSEALISWAISILCLLAKKRGVCSAMVSNVPLAYQRMRKAKKMSTPTLGQLTELHSQITAGRITRQNLDGFLKHPNSTLRDVPLIVTSKENVAITRPTEFIVGDKFSKNNVANICCFLGGFDQWFLDKVERLAEPVETTLRRQELPQDSVDESIIAQLGGIDQAETSLAEIWSLLRQQFTGGDSLLLTNGYPNLFYVTDARGVLRTVSVCSHIDGWLVCASVFNSPHIWKAGSRVFSRILDP
jgi:hypothetical protein